jgi:hypothetical protein
MSRAVEPGRPGRASCRPAVARPALGLVCLILSACSNGQGSGKQPDSGGHPGLTDAASDAITGHDVASTEDSVGVPAPDGSSRADVADTSPYADSEAQRDTATGPDTTAKPDAEADRIPGPEAVADGRGPAEVGPDGAAPTPDGAARADGSGADGTGKTDVVRADLPAPPADTPPGDPSKTLYIALDGNDTFPGTQEQPLASIKKAASLAQPGTRIYMRGGTYPLSATVTVSAPAGTAASPIQLWAYPGEAVVLDFAGAAGIGKGLSIDASYWHVKGLVVENSAGRGIQVSTGTGIVIESCETRGNGDMGLVVSNGASKVLILNCDSHHNFDEANNGENADGFGAKSNVGTGVIFRGCRAWANSDDGWDLYGAPSAVRFEHCWAYKNGDNFKNLASFAGDGNGFKLGKSDGDQAHHVLVDCLAWDNLGGNGYEDNNNTGGLTFWNSVAYKNMGAGFEAVNNTNHILKNNLSFANGKPDNILAGSVNSNNSWNGLTVTAADFLSLDDKVAIGPRLVDGSLPVSDYLHLAPTSGLVDKGADVGLPFLGVAPDLGAYEAK